MNTASDIATYLKQHEAKPLLRFITCGIDGEEAGGPLLMSIPPPSSQRTLGPILTFARSMALAWAPSKIKMDPSVRWDDEPRFHAFLAGTFQVAAA